MLGMTRMVLLLLILTHTIATEPSVPSVPRGVDGCRDDSIYYNAPWSGYWGDDADLCG